MAKFAVGDLARIKFSHYASQIGLIVEVVAIGPFPAGYEDPFDGYKLAADDIQADVIIRYQGTTAFWDEKYLEPIPPDSHADDTTEDPGVTRLKKLLQQDVKPIGRPVKA